MIKNMATVALYVEDQEKAKAFWTEKVGFRVYSNHPMCPNATWLEVGPEGGQTRLVLYPRSMMPNWQELKPSIVFECEDVEETVRRLKEHGVEILEEPKKMAWGTYARFKDMDGNEFILKE